MNFSKQLYQTIQNTIHTFDIIDTFDRESVFADLVKFCRDISSQEDTFKMYFVFNKYKKILLFLREENFVLAEYNLEYLINKNINYSNEVIKDSMDSLYFPVVAYYFYRKKDYTKALLNINEAYDKFDKLYQQGYHHIIFNYVEQKINEFRILIREEKFNDSIDLVKELFQNILSDKCFYHYNITFRSICLNDEELISYLNYIVDICSISLIINKNYLKIEDEHALSFVQVMIDVFSSSFLEKEYITSLESLKLLLKGKTQEGLHYIYTYSSVVLNKNTCCSFAYIYYRVLLEYLYLNDMQLYNKSVSILNTKKETSSYQCFVEKLLQDEFQRKSENCLI